MKEKGRLFVISGPSGAGKSTVVFKAIEGRDDVCFSTSVTYVANSYGTPRKFVEDKLDSGLDVLLDIEVQGARQINEKKPDAVKIFIIPPSLAELRRRLVGRGTDTERAIEARLIRARQEYAEADFYDYIIINDDPDRAAKELAAIMLAERCKAEGRMHFLREAIEE